MWFFKVLEKDKVFWISIAMLFVVIVARSTEFISSWIALPLAIALLSLAVWNFWHSMQVKNDSHS